jgi:hypothetical protein
MEEKDKQFFNNLMRYFPARHKKAALQINPPNPTAIPTPKSTPTSRPVSSSRAALNYFIRS